MNLCDSLKEYDLTITIDIKIGQLYIVSNTYIIAYPEVNNFNAISAAVMIKQQKLVKNSIFIPLEQGFYVTKILYGKNIFYIDNLCFADTIKLVEKYKEQNDQ